MGKVVIRLSSRLVKDFLDLPGGWALSAAYVQLGPLREGPHDLVLSFEGDSIEEKNPPLEMTGTFKSKVIDGEDGRWTQGHWEVYR